MKENLEDVLTVILMIVCATLTLNILFVIVWLVDRFTK